MAERPILFSDEVLERVARIAEMQHDSEGAHQLEDALHREVLAAIAEGAPNAAELARAALRTREIMFERWYS